MEDEGDLGLGLVGSNITWERFRASNCCKTISGGLIMSQFRSPRRTNSEEIYGTRSPLRAISGGAGAEGVL